MPAPFTYGWFNSMFDDERAGIKVIMFWGLWAPILLAFGSLYRFRQLKHVNLKKIRKNSTHRSRKNSEASEDMNEPEISGETLP